MANQIDLRTYILLEKAFIRRLQRSWQQQSAETYAAITKACHDHKWDEARRLVPDLDMAEVGTQNREWITYMLRACAVFGASIIAKKKPSFVGVGSFDTFLKQTTNNFLQYLELNATAQIQENALQLIAEDEAQTKAATKAAWDERDKQLHPRDEKGRWSFVHGQQIRHPTDPEGSGPERAKWNVLNDAVIEANDAEFEARDAHVRISSALEEKYPADTPYTEYNDADFESYRTSKEKALEAARVVENAEATLKRQEPAMKMEIVRNLATGVALRLGIDPTLIEVVHQPAREFMVGDKHFTEAGHYDPQTKWIQLNAANLSYGQAENVRGITAHEVSHMIYHELKDEAEREFQKYLHKATTLDGRGYTPWFYERFTKDAEGRKMRPEFRAELEKEFPAATVLSKLAGHELFTGISTEMIKEDGHSAYAKSYWKKEAIEKAKNLYDSAINETTAEITRFIAHPASWHEDETPQPSSEWFKFTAAMHHWYKTGSEWRKAYIERIRAEHAKKQ